jgi:hypothetical protein
MKKSIVLIFVALFGIAVFSCKDDVTPSHTLNITLALPDGFTLATVPAGVEVKVLNVQTGRESVLTTTETGSATSVLVEGYYNISTSFQIKVGNDTYTFNGVLNNYFLNQESTASVNLILASNGGGLVIKEIYFSGSKTPDNKSYYDDQFHEIYNNSNDTLYADGLCIGFLQQTSNNPNVWLKNDGVTFMDQLPLTFHVWIIPGTGKEHPIYPGKSIVIAEDGINHKTDPNGNPNSPVNLANADWESYVEVSGKDLDSPTVPNMTMMYTTSTTMNDWLHSVFGYAEIIFRLPVDWHTYVANPDNFKTLPGSTSTTKYFMVDKSYVIDAVEIVRVEADKRYKRLPNELDAGYTYLDGGTYCSKSVRRKANLIVNGRVIYKDTNNSSEDFLHDVTPTPGVNPTTVEH